MASSGKLVGLALILLLFMAATIMAAVAGVESYSFPVFNATTTASLVAATNTTVVGPAALLFQPEIDSTAASINVSEGFLLLPDTVDVWRAGAGGGLLPAREASFNTSFTVESSATPVSFVLLLDRFPLFNSRTRLRGANGSADAVPDANATASGLAAVEVGAVRSYEPESPYVGLNGTVTPNGRRAVAVWVEYDTAAHVLRVYVAAGGEPRPPGALIDARLSLAGRRTTQTAMVGFFAATVRDVFLGVRDWDLTVDRLDAGGKKRTSWWVILIAVLGSVAATAAIVTLVVRYFVSRRRTRSMEPKQ
ncbi:hypothetical protein CFC21_034029 [Triticum aestivum]|uniref:Legume lectin domain-containing protein n=3 Tax=Triticum TaxID=4564 RepID=A0A9R1F2S8_WHEAT|nr:uncharacterized protein LOC119271891 [Triticum dicoccoides]XP_044335962.1 uncharacterized protein LOC123056742 [Triticum aestivum]KAF7021014.1 hypothetical protein CFC21_034027 [Triticum aestivum]KAF7021016.1 hypothetical protein CFC21_034029 [Triticum aestivum]VAH57007.1 unnamed protein product [Triticum turgidum subsp. durum]